MLRHGTAHVIMTMFLCMVLPIGGVTAGHFEVDVPDSFSVDGGEVGVPHGYPHNGTSGWLSWVVIVPVCIMLSLIAFAIWFIRTEDR